MRCAIISDIHGNLDALEAVLADAGRVDEIWCLGDLVGYGPQPNECVDLLRRRAAICIAGNHDWAAIGRMDTVEFNPEAGEAARWTAERLTEAHHRYLGDLPERVIAGPAGEFTLVHGSPRDPVWEYLTHASLARPNFEHFNTPYCLVGHTHVPLIFQRQPPAHSGGGAAVRAVIPADNQPFLLAEARLIINPGSVGQPRDGRQQAAYMVFESGADGARITLRRVAYPVVAVQEKMRDAGLPLRLITRLTYGW
jgi:predicted phosphodiesterase